LTQTFRTEAAFDFELQGGLCRRRRQGQAAIDLRLATQSTRFEVFEFEALFAELQLTLDSTEHRRARHDLQLVAQKAHTALHLGL
jgi:hypothetical protein